MMQFEIAKIDRKINNLDNHKEKPEEIKTHIIQTCAVEESKDVEMKEDWAIFDDYQEVAEDFTKLQLLSNFLERNIILYSKDNSSEFKNFAPEVF